MLVLVSVSTEVHAGGDPREGSALLQTQPALRSGGLRLALRGGQRSREQGSRKAKVPGGRMVLFGLFSLNS